MEKKYQNQLAEETELYAEILSEPDNGFVYSSERLSLRKSSNIEVFRHIQSEFLKGIKSNNLKNLMT